ncbi:BZ3500_MvSof-1268-A1-R1_Chr6-2g08495 [Microbotryum saponariae]|uniref:BZ3500_MvSof-1268-A1-R1_Chr6-2g08495 protein n=1 Tax=Microbotryum saponariae TaxID=289078 RepID=A0A2X0NIL2_9BASI|nr:BZ3500_MvSof-1268-A1-R1_Chr6-2g08495 [Microbotryum saponariae]SDA07772.1 BZ3501_MvSof-1269-A2-R1_Chr6-1g08209 [Microbotryum saponariae]
MSTYLAESLNSIALSSALIDALSFRRDQAMPRAILATEKQFEAYMIRDAEPYELALFRPTLESRYDALDGDLIDEDHAGTAFGASGGAGSVLGAEEKWTATKRGGPQRANMFEKASPLKERRGTAAAEDPDRCLRAALKLLSIYSLPRATEHVEALQHQFNGLLETMIEHEEALKKPLARAATDPHEQELQRAADIEEAIKREQMEIFALQQIHAEKQAEVAAASSKTRTRRIPMAKAPLPSPGEANPFAKSDMLEKRAEAVASQGTPARASSGAQPTSASRTTPRANRGMISATASPRSPVKSTPPPKSPAARSPAAGTPKRTPTITSSPGSSRQTTPRAARTPAGVRWSPAKASPKKSKDAELLPSGVTAADLVQYSSKLWATLGDPIRPWAREALPPQDAAEAPAEGVLSIADTLQVFLAHNSESAKGSSYATPSQIRATLRTAINAASTAPIEPVSPARSHATTTITNEDDPLPPSPALAMEYEALNLILSTLSRTPLVPPPSSSLPPLSITLRDAVLPSSLGSAGAATFVAPPPGKKDPMISMNALKLHLSDFAKARGWAEDLVTPTIYSLVSKQVLRIDRRGKEGPMLGFKV